MNRGNITALNKDVVNDINTLKNEIGYCPQSNALFDSLTVNEMVDYYRSLRSGHVIFY